MKNSVLFLFMVSVLLSNCTVLSKSNTTVRSQNSITEIPPSHEIVIPFKLVNKLALVIAEVDGEKGYFIFDTGSNDIVLNSKYFQGRPDHNIQISGHHLTNKALTYKQVSFNWLNDTKVKMDAYITDMEEMENLLNTKILGFVGNSMIHNKEVVFDYELQEITIYVLDEDGNRLSKSSKHLSATDTISIYANSYFPYLNVKIACHNLKVGIDSGTTMNLLQVGIREKIGRDFNQIGQVKNMAFDGTAKLVPVGIVSRMTAAGTHWDVMKWIEGDIDFLNELLADPLDGLLGFEFLRTYKTAINYKKLKIYLWQPDLTQCSGNSQESYLENEVPN